jgi:hypothetical protein
MVSRPAAVISGDLRDRNAPDQVRRSFHFGFFDGMKDATIKDQVVK